MEGLIQFLTSAASSLSAFIPVIPYIFTIIMVYWVMKQFVKPYVRSHSKDGVKFTSGFWVVADKLMPVYSMIGSLICYVVTKFTLKGFNGEILWFLFCGVCSSYIAEVFKHVSKERGIDIPSDF